MKSASWRLAAFMAFIGGVCVLLLWGSGSDEPGQAQTLQAVDDAECRACHSAYTPFIVEDFEAGRMAEEGVLCTTCHGAESADADAVNHNGFLISFTPSPKDCRPCHEDQIQQFNASKHFIGWTKMESAARYIALPDELKSAMCEGCHNIGMTHADGGKGKCDSCHTRHSFSKEEARKPESCGTCHMGPDHPQIEAYLSSKHGVMYSLEGDSWNWSDTATFTAPVCTTCHMPGGTHDVGYGITIGSTSNGYVVAGAALPFPIGNISMEKFVENRAEMVAVCGECHSESFALEVLATADAVKNETDLLVGEAREILIALYNDGLLDPMPEDRTANPVTGFDLTLMGQQLYSNTSGVETLFFKMYKYHGVTAWKGAYHFSPDHTHWYGWAEVNHDLELIKAEDADLRANADLRADLKSQDLTDMLTLAVATASLALALLSLALIRASRKRRVEPPKA